MSVPSADRSAELTATAAAAARTPLSIVGAGTKRFYGRAATGAHLSLAGHTGIVDYAPTELVITARAGTQVVEIERALAEQRQMLAFEPPHFGSGATLGGTIACGFSGPRRPYAGSARDFVLGVTCLAGNGEVLRFGGRVMKNVAGYDVSRLMTGSLGTLGALLEISLKVLPQPEHELTLVRAADTGTALALLAEWGRQPWPLSASAFDGKRLWLRLSGTAAAVASACAALGGDVDLDGARFWTALREHTLPFFAGEAPLWRLSLAPATPPLDLPGDWLYDWGGAQRWLRSDAPVASVRRAATAVGGHATLFRGGVRDDVFHPLPPALMSLHKRLKDVFDPHGIMNPYRLYREW